jgi:hypothetical protein
MALRMNGLTHQEIMANVNFACITPRIDPYTFQGDDTLRTKHANVYARGNVGSLFFFQLEHPIHTTGK